MKKLACLCLLSGAYFAAFGQANFRTNGTGGGDWNQNASWQQEVPNGSGNWITAVTTPTSANNTILIRTGDVITVTAAVTVDQVTVQSNATVTVNDAVALTINDGIGTDFSVLGGNLRMLGESFVTGTGGLVMSTDSHLFVGSLHSGGAISSGVTTGNIRVSSRGYASTSQITYNGTAAQVLGAGHPPNAGVHTNINNSFGVTLNNPGANLITVGALNMVNGNLLIETNSLRVLGDFIQSAGTLTFNALTAARTFAVNGNTQLNGGSFSATSGTATAGLTFTGNLDINGGTMAVSSGSQTTTFLVSGSLNLLNSDLTLTSGTVDLTMTIGGDVTGAHFIQSSGANTNLIVNGTGSLTSTFPFSLNAAFEQLTWNRTGGTLAIPYNINLRHIRLTAGIIDANTNLTVTGDVSLDAGTTFSFRNQTLTLQDGAFNFYLTGGVLDADNTSILNVNGSGPFGTLAFAGGGNTVNTLTINRPTAGPLVFLNSALTISSAFNLTDGDFVNTSGLNMGSGSTITRHSNASMTGAAPTGGAYAVILNGTTLTTGSEVGGTISTINSNVSGTANVGTGGFTATGLLTIASGTMTCAGNSISVGSLLNNGTLNAPSTNLTLTAGNFTNNGVFNKNNGTTNFNGVSSILGSSSSVFQTIVIGGTLNGGSGLSVHGNFTNNGTFNGGSSVVQFLGGTAQAVNGTNASSFASFTVNKVIGVALTLSSMVSVSTGVTLSVGTLNNTAGQLSMANGSLFTRASGTTYTGVAPSNGPYNLTYTGATLGTSGESQGSLNDVTNNLTVQLTLNNVMNVPGTLTLNSGIFSNGSNRLTMGTGATIVRNGNATLTVSIPGGGPYNLTYGTTTPINTGLEARGSLNDVTNNATNTVTLTAAMNVAGTLRLNSGTLVNTSSFLTMGNGSTILRVGPGVLTVAAPQGGPYNLIYNGTTYSTGLEKGGNVNDVTCGVTGTLTLSDMLISTGRLFVNSGTLDCGANIVGVGEVNITTTLIAPSTTLTVTGDFNDSGTYTHNGGSVSFEGTTSFGGTSTTNFNNLQLLATNTLLLPGEVNIAGTLTFFAGSIVNHNSGTIRFNGAGAQDIDVQGTQLGNIEVTKGGGAVTLLSSLPLAHVLSITTATVFNSNGHLTVLSQPLGPGSSTDNDASIASLAGGGSVNGNVIVQRFMIAKGTGNRYISTAVAGVGFSQFTDDMNIGSGYIRYYREQSPGNFANGYLNVTSADVPLVAGRGYLVNIDNNVNVQWDVNGQIHAGTVNFPVFFTPSAAGPSHDGWNLVGNPFPSPIVWDNGSGWSRSNVDPIITVYDINGSALYTHNYINGSGSLPNGVIATGQSFWVHLSAAGSMSVNEPAKVNGAGGSFFRKGGKVVPQMEISLSDGSFTDQAILVQDDNATNEFDALYDGYKLMGERMNIYFAAHDRHLNMNTVRYLDPETRIPLEIQVADAGEFTLSVSGLDKFPEIASWYFVDQEEGVSIPLADLRSYKIMVSNPSRPLTDRFYLSSSPESGVAAIGYLVAYPNPSRDFVTMESADAILDVKLRNASGTLVSGVEVRDNVIDMRALQNGIYLLSARTTRGLIVKKLIKH